MWDASEERAMAAWVAIEKMAKLRCTDLREAQVVILQVPPSQQEEAASILAERLVPGQTLLLSPGKLGSRNLRATLRPEIGLAETSAPLLPVKHRPVWLSSLDPLQTRSLSEALSSHFPNLVVAKSIQEVAINDIGAVLYPASLLLNTARVELMGPYRTAHCDVTPAVARCLRALDQERLQLAQAMTWSAYPLPYLLGRGETDYYRALAKCPEFSQHMAPDSVHHAHLTEEVPYTLSPLLQLAALTGTPVPHLQAVQTLAETVCEEDLGARRSYSEEPLQAAPSEEERPFSVPDLQDTVVAAESSPRPLTLPGESVLPKPALELSLDAEIGRSFQRLREALEHRETNRDQQN